MPIGPFVDSGDQGSLPPVTPLGRSVPPPPNWAAFSGPLTTRMRAGLATRLRRRRLLCSTTGGGTQVGIFQRLFGKRTGASVALTLAAAFAALLGTAFLLAPAIAQDDAGAAARGAACSMVEDSLQRLTCFDKAFPKTATADAPSSAEAPPTDANGTGSWQVTREKSAIDDSPKITAYLVPNEAQSGGLFTKALIVRCVENTTSVIVATDDFQIGADTGAITYRIDGAPAVTARWAMADNNSAMGLWNGGTAIPFLKTLRNAKKLAVRTVLQKQIDMTFDIAGISVVVDEIAAACNWPTAQ